MNILKPSEVLESQEWIQGKLYARDKDHNITGCCMVGAIEQAEETGYPAYELWKYLKGTTITRWNDSPERTKEEVIARLREAEARVTSV